MSFEYMEGKFFVVEILNPVVRECVSRSSA